MKKNLQMHGPSSRWRSLSWRQSDHDSQMLRMVRPRAKQGQTHYTPRMPQVWWIEIRTKGLIGFWNRCELLRLTQICMHLTMPKAIPHASESVGTLVSTPITPSNLTFPPACDHNDPHICPSVSFTRDTAHQPPSSSFALPAQKEGMSK